MRNQVSHPHKIYRQIYLTIFFTFVPCILILSKFYLFSGPGSSVGTTTGGLDGQRIESRLGARLSAPVQTGPGAHPASFTMGTEYFPGVICCWGVTLTPHRFLVPWSRKSRDVSILPVWAVRPVQYSYTSTNPMGRTACTEPQCLYSTAIPLLPLWAVRPVQSLSTCTVELYHYSACRPYALHRASVPVQ